MQYINSDATHPKLCMAIRKHIGPSENVSRVDFKRHTTTKRRSKFDIWLITENVVHTSKQELVLLRLKVEQLQYPRRHAFLLADHRIGDGL